MPIDVYITKDEVAELRSTGHVRIIPGQRKIRVDFTRGKNGDLLLSDEASAFLIAVIGHEETHLRVVSQAHGR